MQSSESGGQSQRRELEMELVFQKGMQKYLARFLFLSIPPDEGERGKLQVNS